MSGDVVDNRRLAVELIKRGIVPAQCRLLEVVIAVNGAAVLRFEKFIERDEMIALAEALRASAAPSEPSS